MCLNTQYLATESTAVGLGGQAAMVQIFSSARAVVCCASVLIMAVPSQMISAPSSGYHRVAFVMKHDTQKGRQEQQQQQRYHPQQQQQQHQQHQHQHQHRRYQWRGLHRQRKHQLGCSTSHARLPSFIAMPSHPTSTSGRIIDVGAAAHARLHSSTALGAASGKGKSSKAAKKKKPGSSRGGGGGGGSSSGGFGAPSATTTAVKHSSKVTPAATSTSTSSAGSTTAAAAAAGATTTATTTKRPSQPAALLPDDDFATFPPLSPDTLKSVMGVDVFDLPPGGVSAREAGQQDALPNQVLACIRDRHGFPEFAGGKHLLDAAYLHEEAGVGSGIREEATAAEAAAVAATAAAVSDGPLETLEGSGEEPSRGVGDEGRESPPQLLFPGLRLLHAEPPVIGVDDFFTSEECDQYIARSLSPPPPSQETGAGGGAGGGAGVGGAHKQRSATLGADVDAVAQRTSTTWFHRFSAVPELMAKASALVGVPFEEGRWEEAQTVRYRPGEKFTWHLDALPPAPELASRGGQRTATLLVYLTDMPEGDGGATAFRDLGPLRVRPRKGSALLFFPSCGGAPDCPFDIRTLHAGEVVRPGGEKDKWIAQLWLRESRYTPTVPKGNKHADAELAVKEFDEAWRGTL